MAQIKTPEKKLNKMEISNIFDAEFKTLVMRMLKELSEDLSNLKKTQSEMKDTLIEIKNDLQGNNSRMDEAENQINDLEHKKAKNNHAEQEEKKNPKKIRIVYRSSGITLGGPTFLPHRGARRRREKARNWKSI